jgi:diaminopimelate decarboxylase
VLDAGTNLLPGTLFAWPTIEAPGEHEPAAGPALVTGPLCSNVDVLHPSADLPALSEGDAVVFRGVGAYQQTQSTQFGDLRPAVVARDDGHWRLVSRRETVEDLIATDLGADVPQTTR